MHHVLKAIIVWAWWQTRSSLLFPLHVWRCASGRQCYIYSMTFSGQFSNYKSTLLSQVSLMNSIMRSQFQCEPAWMPPETFSETLGAKCVLFWFRPDCFCSGTSLVLALNPALFVYSVAFHLLVVFIWTLNTGIKCQPQVSSSLCAAARWDLWRVCAAVSSVHYIIPLSYHSPKGFEFEALQTDVMPRLLFWYSFWIHYLCELKVSPLAKLPKLILIIFSTQSKS